MGQIIKKVGIAIIGVFMAVSAFSQYSVTDEGTVNACSGTLQLGSPSPGQTYVFTLCSDDASSGNSHVSVALSDYSISDGTLCVYDGDNTSAPQIGCNAWQVPWAITAGPGNPTGCLTFVYTTPSSGSGDYFSGEIHCNFMCQHSELQLVSTDPNFIYEDSAYYVNICEGQQVTFNVQGVYTNATYPQSDATSTFTWYWTNDDSIVGQGLTSQTHTFTGHHGYNVRVYMEDQMGCLSSTSINVRVRVSLHPNFNETSLDPTIICPCDPVTLGSDVNEDGLPNVEELSWTSMPPLNVAGTTYLPDGTGASYQTSIIVNSFEPGQTLEDVNDLLGICVNMEHSYLGDLVMQITCPDGTTVTLEEQGGGGTYLGEPVDGYNDATPGVGYDYCWSPNPQYGTMHDEANWGTLPSGSYASDEPLSNLVGCPLNGQWTITVTDNWAADDGFIFGWWLDFDPSLYPDVWQYTNNIVSQTWTAPNSGGQILDDNGQGYGAGTYFCNNPPNSQTQQPFTLTVVDDYGCTYDTTINVIVRSATDPECECYTPPFTIDVTPPPCADSAAIISYNGGSDPVDPSISTFTWDFGSGQVIAGSTDGPGPIWVKFPPGSTNTVSLQVQESYCEPYDTTATVVVPPTLLSSTSSEDASCFGYSDGMVAVQAMGGTPPYSYTWNNGATIDSISAVPAGLYNVTVTDANGCISTNAVVVHQPDSLQITVENYFEVCNGQELTVPTSTIGGTPPYSYSWNGNDYGPTLNTYPDTTIDYNIVVTDANGCTDNATTHVEVSLPLRMELYANRDSICPGDEVVISAAFFDGGGGPYYIYLDDGQVITLPVKMRFDESTQVIVHAKDVCGSEAIDTVDIGVYPMPYVTFIADTIEGCQPFTVTFNIVAGADETHDYIWNFGDNDDINLSLSANPEHTYLDYGQYDVTLMYTTNKGCKDTVTIEDMILVHKKPVARFTVKPEYATILDPEINFINQSSNDVVLNMWDFGDGDSSLQVSPQHIYDKIPNDYTVSLFVETMYGCKDTTTQVVTINDVSVLYAPTAFTPDNDGFNELFYVSGHGITSKDFKLSIYDRWGEKIWETDKYDPDNPARYGWDGSVKGGKKADPGVYVWHCEYTDIFGNFKEATGNITLIR